MNQNNEIEVANFLIERRNENWSVELEAKTVQEVLERDDMRPIWEQKLMESKRASSSVSNQDKFPERPEFKIAAAMGCDKYRYSRSNTSSHHKSTATSVIQNQARQKILDGLKHLNT